MLFQVYGDASIYKFLGWILVFAGLVLANEIARRTKMGGILFFFVLPLILTVYFIAIYASAAAGATWVDMLCQRGLSGAASPHDANELAAFHVETHAVKCLYGIGADCVVFFQISYGNDLCRLFHTPSYPSACGAVCCDGGIL